jgi:4-diphosphocytidyl-2-C-methyl-D-erythritol kinase
MVVFPNAKINLGLNIVRKRGDGYHDLETVFYPVEIKDALETIRSEESSFSSSGLHIDGYDNDNLCVKAFNVLKADFPDLPNVKAHLLKAIPMGAGLGGGSADGAFMLKMLNDKFQLALSTKQLIEYALQLGSDCPFFIINKPCFGRGRGEVLEPVTLDLSAYKFVLVNPRIHVSTAAAFSRLISREPDKSIRAIIEQPIETWKDELMNDFEAPVFKEHPVLADIKEQLYKAGAIYASMSGSGSTLFGVFELNGFKLPVFDAAYTVFAL